MLFYVYGFYGVIVDFYFLIICLSFLDCGFIFVIVYICGSEYLGRVWYEDGKFLKKKNMFIDYIDVLKFLIVEKYIFLEYLYVLGGLVGGLLMGVVVNMVLELYNGVVVLVFFVDVVIMMLDDSILLIIGEYDEWGNFNDKVYYDYMKFYLFYDNVEVKVYLNMLVIIGLYDF